MSGHGHGGVDWHSWLDRLRRSDEIVEDAWRGIVPRLLDPGTRTVLDVGSGTGGIAALFAEAMPAGATIVLVDTTPELLDAADARVRASAGTRVEVRSVLADAGNDELLDLVPRADLVLASFVVHHLPDEQRGVDRLTALVEPGGRLALVEGGLEQLCLPWDLGVGEPGLQGRLSAARGEWFRALRTGIDAAVPMPYGWNRALTRAGLVHVESVSYLVDHPPPPTGPVRDAVLQWLSGVREVAAAWLSADDLRTVDALLDPDGEHHVGDRDDVFLLTAHTVHLGSAPPTTSRR